MPTAFQLKTFPEIIDRMFATAVVQEGDGVDLNRGSLVRTVLEACAMQDADQYVQLARLLDLFYIGECKGDDMDHRALDYGAGLFTDMRRQGARESQAYVIVGDGSLVVTARLTVSVPAGVSTFDADTSLVVYPVGGSLVLERGTPREEVVVYTRAGDVFSLVFPAVTLFPHLYNGKAETQSTKSVLAVGVAVAAASVTIKAGTEAAWPAAGTLILERDTVRREQFGFTRVGAVLTFTAGVTAFAHAISSGVILSTAGVDRAIAVGLEPYVPETFGSVRIPYRLAEAGTLYDGDYMTGLIRAVSQQPGAQTMITSGVLTGWVSAPFAGATVTNPMASFNGRDRENDEAYLQRLLAFVQSLSRGTPLAIETLVAGQTDPFTLAIVAFAECLEPVVPGESTLYVTDGSTNFSIDWQVASGRDVLISVADAGDRRGRLHQYGPFKYNSLPVAQRTPRLFKSYDMGVADDVGADYLEDSTQAWTPDEHIGRWLKTDDDQFYKVASNSAIRLTVEAGGVSPSLGAYSLLHFGQELSILTLGGVPGDGDEVAIGSKTYRFKTVLVDMNGWVLIGGSEANAIANLIAAITLGAGAGTAYAASTTPHPEVTAEAGTGLTMRAVSLLSGNFGTRAVSTDVGAWDRSPMDGGSDPLVPVTSYGFNRTNGEAELMAPLGAYESLVAAPDGADPVVGAYTYCRGLVAFVQRLVNGDRSALDDYPGIKSTGTQIYVTVPTIVVPGFVIQVLPVSGVADADLVASVQAIVAAYVNSLGIGENVILSQIIRLVKGFTQVADVHVLSPSANVSVPDGQLARVGAANVVVV